MGKWPTDQTRANRGENKLQASNQNDFTHSPQPDSQSLLLSFYRLPCVSVCRTRPSSTSRRQARLRPRTSSRRQPSRPPLSRAQPKPTAPLEPRGAPPVGVYNTARTRGPPTRNLGLGPLGPPQALGYYNQSTRLVGFKYVCILKQITKWLTADILYFSYCQPIP